MPEKRTVARARKDLRQGKSASTAAGEFVREEIEHVRAGKHGARSARQAIAIGLSKARRAGVPLKAPRSGSTRKRAKRDLARGRSRGQTNRKTSAKRSRATMRALKREPHRSVSHKALAKHAHTASRRKRQRTS